MPRTLPRADDDPTLLAENGANRSEEVFGLVATILAVFLLFPLPLFWIALLIGAWFLFRRDDRGRTQSAEEILSERYARGEITLEEYRQQREVLRGSR
jgi:uncharacterized membrane protein